MPKALELTDRQVQNIRVSNESQTELAKQYGCSQGTISRIKRGVAFAHVRNETDMTDAELMEGGKSAELEGAEVTLADLSPEDLEVARIGYLRKLQAMGDFPPADMTAEHAQSRIAEIQRGKLVESLERHGGTATPEMSLDDIAEAIAEAREPAPAPEGFDLKYAGLKEGEGVAVTCISRKRVSLGNGQWITFKQRVLVPEDLAEALKDADLCL